MQIHSSFPEHEMIADGWAWEPDPDCDRLLKALQRQGDPGHVPFLEMFADPEVIAAVLDEPAIPWNAQKTEREAMEKALDQKIRFWHGLGYDAFWQGLNLLLPNTPRLETNDTASLTKDQRSWQDEKAGAITNWEEFERYPWPGAKDTDFYPMTYAAEHLPEGMGLLAEVAGALEPVMELMGYETFVRVGPLEIN